MISLRNIPACFLILIFLLFAGANVSRAALTEDELQTMTKEVAKTLRCAVCQSESVWESNAELALQMREIIRERLQQGESPDQIRAYFVSRYGDFILLKPRPFGLNWLLWGGPFILLLTGGLFLTRSIRSWVRASGQSEEGIATPISEADQKKIEEELRLFRN